MSTLPEHKKDIKKNLLFYGAKFFFLSLLDGSLFLQLKIGQSKSFEKASQS